jgi:hypothetical protein
MEKITEYNQAFKDALNFMNKFVYMNRGTKAFQLEATNLCHWIDDNPTASKVQLLQKLAEVMRKYVKDETPRY